MSEAIQQFRERTEGVEAQGYSVVVIGVTKARAVLDRLAELEKQVAETDAPLKVGDRVESLLSYLTLERGMVGTVTKVLSDTWDLPYEVQFEDLREGEHFMDGTVMFKAEELRKVT